MIKCMNHPVRDADFHCAACQVAFCKDCVNLRPYDRGKMEVCPRCQNAATKLAPYKPVVPFWNRVPYFLAWPLQNNAWMLLAGWSVGALVLLGLGRLGMKMGNIFGFVGGVLVLAIYYGLLISYFYRIVAKAEDGNFMVPEFTEFQGLGGSILLAIQFAIAVVAVFWPMIIFAIVWAVGSAVLATVLKEYGLILSIPLFSVVGLLGLMGLILLPMSLLVMGVFRNLLFVLNPIFLITQIKKVLPEYFIVLGLLVGVQIIYSIVKVIFVLLAFAIDMPLIRMMFVALDGVLQLYFFMVLGHLLGYMAYQTRYKLKWWPENLAEPAFMINGSAQFLSQPARPGMVPAAVIAAGAVAGASIPPRPVMPGAPPGPAPAPAAAAAEMQEDLARKIADGMSMLDHGRHQDAAELFKEILDGSPNHAAALRGMVLASLKLSDLDAVREYASRQGTVLCAQRNYEAMWEVLTEIRKPVPNFNFPAKDQFLLARWLADRDQPMDAAKTLRELSVAYPDDPVAPKALYQCAELLWRKLDKTDAATQMFSFILKRYPAAGFDQQIQTALHHIKTGK